VYFLSYVPMLFHLQVEGAPEHSPRLVFFLVFVTQVSDVLQYVFGKLLGRRPLAPRISPNKTVEGLLGGGLVATMLGIALHGLTPFGPLGTGALAAVVVLAGAVGGLVMSAVKRSLSAKDWGAAIAGHGGIMDRVDSIVFSAPLFFHLVVYYGSVAVPNTRPPWLSGLLGA
jgi:phosphatidate cytidylyltransferase